MKEPDFSGFPPGTVTEYTTLVCLACFDIFTKQMELIRRMRKGGYLSAHSISATDLHR